MIAIIGSKGFIGSAVANRFAEKNINVLAIPTSSKTLNLEGNCDWLSWMLSGVETVYLCAGRTGGVGRMASDPMSFILPNVRIQMNVYEACAKAGVKRIVTSQSITGYPDTPEPVKESDYYNGELHKAYQVPGTTWRFIGKLSEMFKDIEFVFVRPSNVYGPGNDFDLHTSHVIEATVRKIYEKQDPMIVWGTGDEVRDPTYIDDLADAMTMCLDCEPGAYNIGTGQSVSVNQMIKILCDHAGYHPDIKYDITKPTAIPARYLDCTRATNVMGWKPKVDIIEGLQRTYDYYANL